MRCSGSGSDDYVYITIPPDNPEMFDAVTEVIGRVLLVNASLVLLALISVVEPDPLVDIPLLMLGTAFVAWLLITLARGKR